MKPALRRFLGGAVYGALSLGFHGAMAVAVSAFWFYAMLLGLFGEDGEGFGFRYRNPYLKGTREEPPSETTVSVDVVRRRRPRFVIPEFERPSWDSIRLRFQLAPGRPCEVDSPLSPQMQQASGLQARGEDFDFVSDKPFKGKGIYDVLGQGSEAGGKYGSPTRGKDRTHLALFWLARHQNEDGSWSAAGFSGRCNRALPNARTFGKVPCASSASAGDETATGLALLAFLGAGYSVETLEKWDGISFGEVVRNALKWIAARQREDGRIGEATEGWLGHVVCGLALSESCRPRWSKRDFEGAAQGAAALTSESLAGLKGTPAGWAALAVKSARLAKFEILEEAEEIAKEWLEQVADPALLQAAGAWGMPGRSLQERYFAAIALDKYDVPGSGAWDSLRSRIESFVGSTQLVDEEACAWGSWEAAGPEWVEGGRVACTALHALALECCPGYTYRFGDPEW